MEKIKRLKILDFVAGFFLLIWVAMIFFRWTRGENFFFWLGAVSFVLFLLLFREYKQTVKSEEIKLPAPKRETESEKELCETSEDVKKFRDLIHKIAESKNIEIEFARSAGSGHVDLPEQWFFGKPIPLTPGELYELGFFRSSASMRVLPHDDGLLYAREFYFSDDERIAYNVSPEYFAANAEKENSES